ncbi:hypothetical protein MPER_11001 [Moniliophthora perniciosa FA553]|nr:hypothetical protein MPER_11001 [Moniliophthora perniciosa FA553]
MPIGTGFDAERLEGYSQTLIRDLIRRKVKVISYACDGTEVERSVEKLLMKHADSRIEFKISSPKSGGRDIQLVIPIFDGQPVAMVQDSKHALKTFRNNLFSGARLLVLGNYCAFYAQVHKVASDRENSPVFIKDVDNADKQDDNAATRLFSAATLKYLAENHPEWAGLIVYLFVFGELIDAYQNRKIDHCERLAMVLRARYILDLWGDFLECSGYSKTQYFLSRECLDITRIVIEGYLALLIIHRDHLPETVPFLPWLHSSEACEHCFGICRQIVKDFCYADFLYMIPKLCVAFRQAVLRARVTDSKAQTTQSGYNHTYFDHANIDLVALSTFPTQDQLKQISHTAFQEADSLFIALGIDPGLIRRVQALRSRGISQMAPIRDWGDFANTLDSDSENEEPEDSDTESISEAQRLQELVDRAELEEVQSAATRVQQEKLASLSYAAAALNIDDHIKVQRFADGEGNDDALDEEYLDIESYQKQVAEIALTPMTAVRPIAPMPSIFGKQGVTISSAASFDYSALITLRENHQTRQAETGVRGYRNKQQAKSKDSTTANDTSQSTGARAKIIKAMNDVLKDIGEHGLTTGTGRSMRTKAMNSNEDSTTTTTTTGNSANAAAAAATVAKAVQFFFLNVHNPVVLILEF